ncbi:hypothetical protein MRB53_037255 [Persea americana]|nr:hypothetical protein MRB53_037255 [Persea americana]
MGVYRPAQFPRRSKQNNVFTELRYQAQMIYYRYELSTGQYVMSPGEKLAFNLIVASILVLLFSAIYYYLPRTIALSLNRLAYYATGSHKMHVTHVLQQLSSGASSMTPGDFSNASSLMA